MITALEGGKGSGSRPGPSLPPGKTRYPLYRRLGGPQGRSGQVRKISPPPGFDPRTVQPVASRYTDYATRPTDTGVPASYSNAQERLGGGGCALLLPHPVRPVSCRVGSVTFVAHNYTAHANAQMYFYLFSLVLPVMSILLILNDK
jgi:hypothetical protein